MDELDSRRTGTPFPSFRASSSWIPGTSHTELATIVAGSRRAHISRIWISAAQAANSVVKFRVYRKAADNTGGTSSNIVPCKHENTSPDPTAVVRVYTAAPAAVGTEDGAIRTTPILISGGGVQTAPVEWNFVPSLPEGLILAPGEKLGIRAVDMDATGTFFLTVEWYENPDV